MHTVGPLLPSLQAPGSWCSCPRSSAAGVAGLGGDFDGDASNDLQSRQGVLEPIAELATHSWHLSPLCPEPGDLPHPCTVSKGRKWEREWGAAVDTWGVWRLGAVEGSGWSMVLHLQVTAHRAAWAHSRCGVLLQPLCPVPHGGAPTAAL